jgi:ABC-2 type transport system permease protein
MTGNLSLRPAARLRRIAALIRKESWQIVRDPSSILIALVLPLILLFIFGYGVSLDARQTRIGLVVETSSPVADGLAASFDGSRYFAVSRANNRRAFEDALLERAVRGIVIIPTSFAEDVAAGRQPQVQLLLDGGEPNTASLVQGYVRGVLASWAQRRAASAGRSGEAAISVEPRYWFNAELESRNFLVPGSVAIVMTLVGTLLTSLVIAREWERGTMEAIMATPVTAGELLIGKVVPYFVLSLLSMTLCVVLAVFQFGVPLRGSLFALYVLSSAFLVPALGQGILISAVTKNQFLASQVAMVSAFLPAFLLSGFIFEVGSMPWPIQLLTYIVPARYLIPAMQSVFLAGDIWPLFFTNMAAMLVIGGVFFTLAALSSRKRLS